MSPKARASDVRPNATGELAGFLHDLGERSSLTPRTPLPDVETDVRQAGPETDLAARFADAAAGAGLHVHRVAAGDWVTRVREILAECGAKAVFVEAGRTGRPAERVQNSPHSEPRRSAKHGPQNAFDLAAASEATPLHFDQLKAALDQVGIAIQTDSSDETLFSVDAGITGVECAVAETGTLVCQSGAGQARGASLVPPVHVAVVSAAQIVPDLYDYLAGFGAGSELPANVNLITGPSKTADIEGILVTGVHGPREVHVVLVNG